MSKKKGGSLFEILDFEVVNNEESNLLLLSSRNGMHFPDLFT